MGGCLKGGSAPQEEFCKQEKKKRESESRLWINEWLID